MTIQKINLGTSPTGVGGDTLRSTATKINENFSNTAHAASRLVGKDAEQIPEIKHSFGIGGLGYGGRTVFLNDIDLDNVPSDTAYSLGGASGLGCGFYYAQNGLATESKLGRSFFINVNYSANQGWRLGSPTSGEELHFQWATGNSFSTPVNIYHTGNTTKDANGFLKAASPIVKVHADKVVLNGKAEEQNVTFKKNGIGDYTITTESGLSTDGWYLELPKDLNGNPKVAVTLSEVEGVITLKSYKRIFSMETFTFEPDLDNPLDIPTDRWIDIRLNEIPVDYTELDKEPTEPYSEV